MARLQKGVFNPAAFLYTVKKRSMVDFVLLSVIREGLSVEGQLCHLEGIFIPSFPSLFFFSDSVGHGD